MPRVLILPHYQNDNVFSRIAPKANDCQADFQFYVLPPDEDPTRPTRKKESDFRQVLEYLHRKKISYSAGAEDLLLTFFDGNLHAAEAGLGNLFMAGSRY